MAISESSRVYRSRRSWPINDAQVLPISKQAVLNMSTPHRPEHCAMAGQRRMWSVTLCIILGTLCISQAQDSNTAVSTEVANASDSFSVELLKVVFGANDKNTVVSPVSVSTLLSILQQGSGGNTEAQLTQVLRLDSQQSRQGYSQLTRNLKESSGNVTLEFANAAFLKEEYPVKPQFENILEQDFQATIQPTDFNNSSVAADDINSWVANKTHNNIQNLVSPDLLPASTILVLVNAIYFKGLWKIPFQKRNTKNDNFFVQPNSPKEVPTMHLQANLLTGNLDALDSRWLKLPFEGDRFYLLIILPNAQDGVQSLVNNINGPEIFDLISNLESRGSSPQVELSVPKFKLETKLQLIPALQEIGLTDIFTDQANLSGISQQSLLVSEVVQKAHIEVDEEGATAAAATALQIIPFAMVYPPPPPPLEFTVDHQFIVFIVDNLNKLPLFVCRVTDPTVL